MRGEEERRGGGRKGERLVLNREEICIRLCRIMMTLEKKKFQYIRSSKLFMSSMPYSQSVRVKKTYKCLP